MIDTNALLRMLAQQGRMGDTELAHVNPFEKQVLELLGGSGERNPNTGLREFAAADYLSRYSDVAKAGVDPWTHFQQYGQKEGRIWDVPNTPTGYSSSNPIAQAYLNMYPDVKAAGVDPWTHYQQYGKNEGRVWEGAVGQPSTGGGPAVTPTSNATTAFWTPGNVQQAINNPMPMGGTSTGGATTQGPTPADIYGYAPAGSDMASVYGSQIPAGWRPIEWGDKVYAYDPATLSSDKVAFKEIGAVPKTYAQRMADWSGGGNADIDPAPGQFYFGTQSGPKVGDLGADEAALNKIFGAGYRPAGGNTFLDSVIQNLAAPITSPARIASSSNGDFLSTLGAIANSNLSYSLNPAGMGISQYQTDFEGKPFEDTAQERGAADARANPTMNTISGLAALIAATYGVGSAAAGAPLFTGGAGVGGASGAAGTGLGLDANMAAAGYGSQLGGLTAGQMAAGGAGTAGITGALGMDANMAAAGYPVQLGGLTSGQLTAGGYTASQLAAMGYSDSEIAAMLSGGAGATGAAGTGSAGGTGATGTGAAGTGAATTAGGLGSLLKSYGLPLALLLGAGGSFLKAGASEDKASARNAQDQQNIDKIIATQTGVAQQTHDQNVAYGDEMWGRQTGYSDQNYLRNLAYALSNREGNLDYAKGLLDHWKANAYPDKDLMAARKAEEYAKLGSSLEERKRSYLEDAAKRGLKPGSLSGGLSSIERGAQKSYAELANELLQFEHTPQFAPPYQGYPPQLGYPSNLSYPPQLGYPSIVGYPNIPMPGNYDYTSQGQAAGNVLGDTSGILMYYLMNQAFK